ncbi:hypothetical protein [Dictyobacter formicarum]|uniref:hypothetical protein n=1 Tax=Dictyobacter formicarum TaxID=2778368 RepID=UPI0019159D73|nr:hypothetical protein [Dictyobacter formicarum]
MADIAERNNSNSSFPIYVPLLSGRDASVKNELDFVAVIVPREDRCGGCGRHLLTLFDFNLRHSAFSFLAMQGQQLRIAMCPTCTLLGDPVYSNVNGDGLSQWSQDNGEEPVDPLNDLDDWEDLPHISCQQLQLGSPYSTLPEGPLSCRQKGLSYVGNVPTWIHSSDYPYCPGCQQRMLFVGQLNLADLRPDVEGIIYAFLCSCCGKAANACQVS